MTTEIKFAPMQEERATSVDEAIQLLKGKFAFTPQYCELRQLSVDEGYHIHINGDVVTPTNWAFKNFLGQLQIPYTFGIRIPQDLLDTIVSRLRERANHQIILLRRNGTVVNVVPGNYWAPELARVIQLFEGQPAKSIFVSDKGLRFASESIVGAEPTEGDAFKLGVLLRGSETGGPAPYAVLETHRLVCGNDAIMHPEWGQAKWDRRIRNDGFEAFQLVVQTLLQRSEALIPALMSLPERTLDVREFRHLWLQSSKVVGGAGADILFGVDESERKEFSNAAKARLEVETELNAYTVFNALTLCARDLRAESGEKMMGIAGQLLGRPER